VTTVKSLFLSLAAYLCRKRSFALFFAGGEDESVAREHVGECRPWPQQFREKKALCGLAAAAIVSVSKEIVEAGDCETGGPSKGPTSPDVSRILGAYPYGAILGTININLYHPAAALHFLSDVTVLSIELPVQ
jgi:hypothetical protein